MRASTLNVWCPYCESDVVVKHEIVKWRRNVYECLECYRKWIG